LADIDASHYRYWSHNRIESDQCKKHPLADIVPAETVGAEKRPARNDAIKKKAPVVRSQGLGIITADRHQQAECELRLSSGDIRNNGTAYCSLGRVFQPFAPFAQGAFLC
jgi:hypothetical protein